VGEATLSKEERVKGFRDLKVWEKAHQLTLQVYKASASFPKEEMYGLTSQIRRVAASIPANIAEGTKQRRRIGTFSANCHGFSQRVGVSPATRDLLLLAEKDYGQLTLEVTEVKRMLASFIQKLNADR
jgi:23S rRNA-intervening sequence protein